jgi:hypothetical protein
VKQTLTTIYPPCEGLIKQARLLGNAKLLIEATTEDARDELLMKCPPGCFGESAFIKRLNETGAAAASGSKVWLVAFDVHKEVNVQHLQEEFQRHHPSIEQVTVLPPKEGTAAVARFCVPVEEAESILRQGCFADFRHYRVSKSISRPLRCFNCQRYGHVASVCRSQRRCCRCGSSDELHPKKCITPPSCCNCSGEHPANHRDCPDYTKRLKRQV